MNRIGKWGAAAPEGRHSGGSGTCTR